MWSVRHAPSVHPHACGEYYCAEDRSPRFDGSSPRLWGVLVDFYSDIGITRFIPTPVGSIARKKRSKRYFTVHPHACGEYSLTELQGPIWSGSSPRLWGV